MSDLRYETRLELQPIELPAPWQGALLPLPLIPVPRVALDSLNTLFGGLADILVTDHQLHHEVFFQVSKLAPGRGSEVLSAHAGRWPFELGLGVWPGRDAPSGWSETSLLNFAAAKFRGAEPELPSYRVSHLRADAPVAAQAASLMRGFGAQLECFVSDPATDLFARTSERFLPSIAEHKFRQEDFYIPLLEMKSLRRVQSVAQLENDLCGIDVYLRESGEDNGILVVSRLPLEPLLARVQQRLKEQSAARA